MTAKTRITAIVNNHPDFGSVDSDYLSTIVDSSMDFVVGYCLLKQFPDDLQAYSLSASGASTSIYDLDTTTVCVSVNKSGFAEVTIGLETCTTGSAIATALQAAIRAVTDSFDYGFEEVTVTFTSADSTYRVTSGRYGEKSEISFSANDGDRDVIRALKLSPDYGGVEMPGAKRDDLLERAAAGLAIDLVNQIGLEGFSKVVTPSDMELNLKNINPLVTKILNSRRRLW